MKYALLIFHDEKEGARTPDALAPWREFSEAAPAHGVELAGAPLDSSKLAKLISRRNGKTIVTDGPFADTKEQLCGYYLFDCQSHEAALKLAEMIPVALIGHVEVRPVVDFDAASAG